MRATNVAITAGAAVLVALLSWNAWTLAQLSARVSSLETTVATATETMARTRIEVARAGVVDAERASAMSATEEAPRARPSKSRRGSGTRRAAPEPPSDEARDERYERVASQWLAMLELEVDGFAADEGLTDYETDELFAELDGMYRTIGDIREDVKAGEMTLTEAKAELRIIKEDADGRISDLLGPERRAALQARLRTR